MGSEARLPLAGARIVLTRPAKSSDALARRLAAAGARTLHFPALRLLPVAPRVPAGHFDLAVFVSPAAVRYGLPRLSAGLPPLVAAPGRGTAATLAVAGVAGVVTPDRGTGIAALLDGGALGRLAGRRVLLVCGRPANRRSARVLRAQGAVVVPFTVYTRRGVEAPEPLAGWLRAGEADAIMVSSTAAAAALGALGGMDWGRVAWIVSSRRVAAAARAAGGQVGAVAEGAGDAEMAAAAAVWWHAGRTTNDA